MPAPAKTRNIRALYSNLLQYRAHFTHKIILYTIIARFCWGRKCNLTVWVYSLLLKSCKLGSWGNSCVVNYSVAWPLFSFCTTNKYRDGDVLTCSSGCAGWRAGSGSARSSPGIPRTTPPQWSCHLFEGQKFPSDLLQHMIPWGISDLLSKGGRTLGSCTGH